MDYKCPNSRRNERQPSSSADLSTTVPIQADMVRIRGRHPILPVAVIFMAHIEKQLLASSPHKPIIWKRFIDDIVSVWTINENEINDFVLFANSFHPTIVTTFNPASPNLKKILMKHWHLIESNANLTQIFSSAPIVAYRKDKSLKDLLVRAKIPSLD